MATRRRWSAGDHSAPSSTEDARALHTLIIGPLEETIENNKGEYHIYSLIREEAGWNRRDFYIEIRELPESQ